MQQDPRSVKPQVSIGPWLDAGVMAMDGLFFSRDSSAASFHAMMQQLPIFKRVGFIVPR